MTDVLAEAETKMRSRLSGQDLTKIRNVNNIYDNIYDNNNNNNNNIRNINKINYLDVLKREHKTS